MNLPAIDKIIIFILPGIINWFCCLALLIVVLIPHETIRQETSDKFLFVVLGGISLIWTLAGLVILRKEVSRKEVTVISFPVPIFLFLCFARERIMETEDVPEVSVPIVVHSRKTTVH